MWRGVQAEYLNTSFPTLYSYIQHNTALNILVLHPILFYLETMQISTYTIFTSFLASLASAACYPKGVTGDPQLALNGIDAFCKASQGYFVKNQDRAACIGKAHTNRRWVVVLSRPGENGGTMTYDYCMKRLRAEISCTGNKGGDSSTDWWFVRYDE